jgi:Ser/Thr protein kinase RdoA (MazF antagonist)
VIVQTSSGKKVLKRHRARHGTPALTYANSILKRLALLNFPAPRLVATQTGDTIAALDDGNYALFDFVEGTNYSSNFILPVHRVILMSLAGQTLARLHRALEGFMPEGQHHLGFRSYTGGWQRDLSWHAAKVDELREKSCHLRNDYDRTCADWIVRNSRAILDEVQRLDETLRNAPLPRLIVHGDYGLHNIIFQHHAIIPMDFESSRLEWRLSDLVSALSRLRRRDGSYNFESIRGFLDGYHSVFPISEDEWRYLPQVWRFYKLRASLIYWNSYFETGGPVRKLLSSRDAVSQAQWVNQYPEKLLKLNAVASM